MLTTAIILLTISILSFCISFYFSLFEESEKEEPEDFEYQIIYQIRNKRKKEREELRQSSLRKGYTIAELQKIRSELKNKNSNINLSDYCYQKINRNLPPYEGSGEMKNLKLQFNYINNYHHNSSK